MVLFQRWQSNMAWRKWSRVTQLPVSVRACQSPLTSHSEAVHILSPTGSEGRRDLLYAKASGILLLQPFQSNAEMQYMQARYRRD